MLSFDQNHFTFHNETEQMLVIISVDSAKEVFKSTYACLYLLESGIRSAIIFLL